MSAGQPAKGILQVTVRLRTTKRKFPSEDEALPKRYAYITSDTIVLLIDPTGKRISITMQGKSNSQVTVDHCRFRLRSKRLFYLAMAEQPTNLQPSTSYVRQMRQSQGPLPFRKHKGK